MLNIDTAPGALLTAFIAAGIYRRANSGLFKPKEVRELRKKHIEVEKYLYSAAKKYADDEVLNKFYDIMTDLKVEVPIQKK
jgi:hypothetical protein